MNGIPDPEEDINNDGKHDILDCLPEELRRQVESRMRRTVTRVSVISESDAEPVKEVEAVCDDGYVVISGGFDIESANNEWLINVKKNYPSADNTWLVRAEAAPLVRGAWSVTAWAICDSLTQ
jgi:hypothetical protein